ncbi:MAG: oxaloacetate decarboxylase [Ruminococcaceae bacterium]|nr:oxaloacetate decarboxylase [Oscillospiraceae bacterium]
MYFEIGNFVENLKHMGVGMLTIFIVIGVIMTVTALLNKIFSK